MDKKELMEKIRHDIIAEHEVSKVKLEVTILVPTLLSEAIEGIHKSIPNSTFSDIANATIEGIVGERFESYINKLQGKAFDGIIQDKSLGGDKMNELLKGFGKLQETIGSLSSLKESLEGIDKITEEVGGKK